MRMRLGISIASLLFVAAFSLCPVVTQAATTEASKIPQAEVCRNGKVSPSEYMDWVFDNFDVKRKCTGRDTARQIALLSDPDVEAKKCGGVSQAQNLTGLLISQSSKVYSPARPVQDTPANRALFLKGQIAVHCNPQPVQGGGSAESVPGPKSPLVYEMLPPPFKVRIRGSQDSLRFDQGTPGFKKASGAKFSIARDQLAGETQYYSKGVVGLDTGERFIGDHTFQLTPYFTGERKFNTNRGTQGDINKLGGGLLANFDYTPLYGPLHFGISVDPQYLTDSLGNTRIWGGNLRVEPALMLPGNNIFPGGPRIVGPVVYDLDLNFLGRYSRVDDNGGRPELSTGANYSYGGPEFKLNVAGAEGTMIDRFSLALSYYNLYRFHGQYDRIEMFTAELKYALDAAGFFELALGYENGRDIEQFIKREGWTLTLTYKY